MSDYLALKSDAEASEDQDRYGEEITVACRQCELLEGVLFDVRDRQPWSGVEPCDECGAPAAERYAVEDGWEYVE